MREIKRAIEIKEGKKWVETYADTVPATVYASLSHDLIAKKINGCTYIQTIKRTQNYDGTITITVNYNNDTRSVYTVAE